VDQLSAAQFTTGNRTDVGCACERNTVIVAF
jgi:hypothetical protein